jgi:hypothetical protein
MIEMWHSLTLLQKAGVVALAWAAAILVAVCVWDLIVGRRRADDEDEFREAVRRKARDDERGGGGQP